MQNFEEKTVQSQTVYQGDLITLKVDEVLLPDGTTGKRELVTHPGAVAVIPFTADGRLVVVRQYRKALRKHIYEIPAGCLKPGEDPAACGRRELAEETGYQAGHLQFITSFYTSPGFADELIYLYEAHDLQEGQAHPDEGEYVETKRITLQEGLDLQAAELIHDNKTAYALLYWQHKLLKKQD